MITLDEEEINEFSLYVDQLDDQLDQINELILHGAKNMEKLRDIRFVINKTSTRIGKVLNDKLRVNRFRDTHGSAALEATRELAEALAEGK